MMKFTTRFISVALTTLVVMTTLNAGTPTRVVDTRTILSASSTKDVSVQATAFSKPLNLQRAAAEQLFAERPSDLQLTNFPLPGRPDASLTLRRTPDVINESTEIVLGTKNGGRRITVKPISSYIGTVNDDPNTRVSLHYSTDDLTGMIQMSDGSRVLIGRDGPSTTEYIAHSIFVEGALEGGSLLKNFVCGVDEAPVTVETLNRSSKDLQVEKVQNGYLNQIRVAVELKEDIDSVMRRRGMNDEQMIQYIAKLWAAVSQVYEQELNAQVFITYLQKYTEDEPSPYESNGRNPGALLGEFSGQWRQKSSPERTLAHLMTLIRPSGGSYVGGIAYGGNMNSNLCNPTSNVGSYSVSTIYTTASDVPGQPTRSNGFVWDVFVIAHEMGHNCGASHTHSCDWNPPIDTCQLGPSIDGTDGCVNNPNMRRPQAGTIMSYCHLVNGSSTPLTFGPTRVTSRMAGWIDGSVCVKAPPAPTVTLTSPRGSESWNSGQNVDILWVSEGVTNVKLEYSPNAGGSWTEIVASVPTGFKKYSWTVPNVGTTDLLIRISDVEDSAVSDTSLARFTIVVPQLPAVALVQPKGGERIKKGSRMTVIWTKVNVGTVSLDFAPDGNTWTTLVSDTNATSYSWLVPDISTSNAKMRIRSAADQNVFFTSGDFAIGAATFQLIKPQAGDTLCQLFDNGFIWSGDFVEKIKIRFTTATTPLANAISSVSVPVGPGMLISSPPTAIKNLAEGTVIQLHIIDDSDESVLQLIPGIIVADCALPSAVNEEIVEPSDLTIAGITPSPANQNAVLTLSTAKPLTCDVSITDMSGASTNLRSNIRIEGNGLHYIDLPLQTLANGAYVVSVRSGAVQVSTPLRIAR